MPGTVPDYHLGEKGWAAIGTTKIKGLNNLKVPGIVRGSVKIEEFDRDFDFERPTSASWEKGSMAGNYVRGDKTGQRALRQKLFANEGLNNLRLGEDKDSFWAPDLANDPNSQFFVSGMPGPAIKKSGVTPFSADLMVQGLLALFDAHITGITLAFTATTATDSGSGFITAGFEVGDSIIIDGSTSNDVVSALVTGVEAGVLTWTVISGTCALEPGLVTTTIHGGSL